MIKEEIKLQIQFHEIEAYAWINSKLLRQILFGDPENENKMEFSGFHFVDGNFEKVVFDKNNLFNRQSGEYLPYGHYLACNYFID